MRDSCFPQSTVLLMETTQKLKIINHKFEDPQFVAVEKTHLCSNICNFLKNKALKHFEIRYNLRGQHINPRKTNGGNFLPPNLFQRKY